MQLHYFDLLSPEPIYLPNIGGVRCPTLREINKITYNLYRLYLVVLSMTPKVYFDMAGQVHAYERLSDEQKSSLHIFDLITQNEQYLSAAENALNFFLECRVRYDGQHRYFVLYDSGNESPVGTVEKNAWIPLCDVILQRNCIKQKSEDLSKVKSKKALSIIQKLQKGRENKSKQTTEDNNMELGNIISAVAGRHPSLNLLNIWDITVYQLWDTFYRLCNNHVLDIQSMSIAAWGDKNGHFDPSAWYKKLSTD